MCYFERETDVDFSTAGKGLNVAALSDIYYYISTGFSPEIIENCPFRKNKG
jgi:hypothetical protein